MLKVTLFIILLSATVVNLSGCIFLAAGVAGVGTAKWLSDKVTQVVDHPLEKVEKSTKAALADMRITMYKETNAPDVTQILGKDAEGRQVWVDLRPLDAEHTRIDVRVGYANGETDAAKILDVIVRKSESWF